MHTRIRILLAAISLIYIAEISAAVAPASTDFAKSLADAAATRASIASGVAKGSLTATSAISQLKASTSPTGLNLSSGAELGYAAGDIGRRLVALGKNDAAAEFFKTAEASLVSLIAATADKQNQEKARYLKEVALLHCEYLNDPARARKDIEQALALDPSDQNLKEVWGNLARGHAEVFSDGGKE